MTEKRPNLSNHNQWVLYARANNYPECDLCHEPLSRRSWKKGRCDTCLQLDARIANCVAYERDSKLTPE